MTAEQLRRAADTVIDLAITGGRPSFGSHESWIQEMPADAAEALAAWLRAEAAQIAIICRDVVDPTEPGIVHHIEYLHKYPLALARSILGEQP